jgi:hypothetical protein
MSPKGVNIESHFGSLATMASLRDSSAAAFCFSSSRAWRVRCDEALLDQDVAEVARACGPHAGDPQGRDDRRDDAECSMHSSHPT